MCSLQPGACLGISVFQPSFSLSLCTWYITSSFSGAVNIYILYFNVIHMLLCLYEQYNIKTMILARQGCVNCILNVYYLVQNYTNEFLKSMYTCTT
jgi:hypothetical protein